jgi:hypothetical protein
MHDIDRTLMEYEEYDPETEAYEATAGYDDEYETADEEYDGEYEGYDEVFDEAEEMELAAELLGVTDEEELEYFLGKLIKKVGRRIKKAIKSPTGRALARILKGAAKKALPVVGTAVGTAFGGPVGGAIGGKAASAAGRVFGLELEGLSPEDQEFEVAKRVVRLAGDAAKKAAAAQDTMPPVAAAKAAVVSAARKNAPGLLRPAPAVTAPSVPGGKRSGRWMRRGSRIVLIGV